MEIIQSADNNDYNTISFEFATHLAYISTSIMTLSILWHLPSCVCWEALGPEIINCRSLNSWMKCSIDILVRRSENRNPAEEKPLSFSAEEAGIAKYILTTGNNDAKSICLGQNTSGSFSSTVNSLSKATSRQAINWGIWIKIS